MPEQDNKDPHDVPSLPQERRDAAKEAEIRRQQIIAEQAKQKPASRDGDK